MNPMSLTLGWLAGKRMAQFCREADPSPSAPRAYLYNGVELPPLPEWDKETYPYVVMRQYIAWGTYYHVYMCKSPVYVTTGDDGRDYMQVSPHLHTVMGIGTVTGDDIEWDDLEVRDTAESLWIFKDRQGMAASDDIVWSNHDVLKSDGTVYMAASEPVPVYD